MNKLHLGCMVLLVACGGRSFDRAQQTGGRSGVDGGSGRSGVDGGALLDGGEPLTPGDGDDGGTVPLGGAPNGGSASGGSGRPGDAGNATGGNVAAAGTNSGGDAGAVPGCESLPDRGTWGATAFPAPAGWPAAAVVDGDPETRWTSERPTQGDEWVTVEFPEPVTLTAIVVRSVFEPGEGWAVRLGNDLDRDSNPIVAQGAGDNAEEILGDVLMQFEAPASGAFLTLQQTGAKADSAWSVYEITPVCEQSEQ